MNTRGMSLLEYSILLTTVVISILFMSVYIRRAVLGRIHEDVGKIASPYEYGGATISTSVTNFLRNVSVNVEITNRLINGVDYDVITTRSNIIRDETTQTVNKIIIH